MGPFAVAVAGLGVSALSFPPAVSAPTALAPPVPAGGGDFDWSVEAGETFLFDTSAQVVVDRDTQVAMLVQNGVLIVDDVHIEAGAEVRVSGPNPLRILATGEVRIDGTIDVGGFDGPNVQTLNLAYLPQPGGLGGPGGGEGGVGSPLTTSSTPRGGPGEGAFGVSGLGGVGGESGYDGSFDRNHRRPGGGGGGAFGPNVGGQAAARDEVGLVALPGFDGFDSTDPGFDDFVPPPTGAFGAETGQIPPQGGEVGPSVFEDSLPRNDFWGAKLSGGGPLQGELGSLWAGSGGGAGGDAIRSDVFPSPQFVDPGTLLTPHDTKAGGGGGGGGALHVITLDEIVFGSGARVAADGGSGGTGESTFFIDRIGGGGGGGSGGHLVFEAAERVVFETPADPEQSVLSAVGGAGALGLPIGENERGTDEFDEIYDVLGYPVNQGGDGGPGVIQIHVPVASDGSQEHRLVLPPGTTLRDLTKPDAHLLLPIFVPQVNP